MQKCTLCPNNCGVDRSVSAGFCGVGENMKIARYALHFFEEPMISGTRGSGTIFFCGCSLRCVFCQNYDVSRNKVGKEINTEKFIEIVKELEDRGAHNINLVNPTHYSKQIVDAFKVYRPKVPVVWNTHGYESLETLKMVDPFVDIYLTDLKYFSPKVAARYSAKSNYFEVASSALEFMLNAKITDLSGDLMKSGVIVRHLVLPLNTNDSVELLRYLRPKMRGGAILSIMSQYTPFGEIENYPELKRKITKREYNKVVDEAISLNFEQVFIQEDNSSNELYIPEWDYS